MTQSCSFVKSVKTEPIISLKFPEKMSAWGVTILFLTAACELTAMTKVVTAEVSRLPGNNTEGTDTSGIQSSAQTTSMLHVVTKTANTVCYAINKH